MERLRKFLGYFSLVVIAVSMLYPFFAMLNLSLVPNGEIFNQGGKLLYSPLTLNNYVNVFEKIPLWKYFVNSLFVAVVTTFGQVIISALAGYFFACVDYNACSPSGEYYSVIFLDASIALDKYLSSFNCSCVIWRFWSIFDASILSRITQRFGRVGKN